MQFFWNVCDNTVNHQKSKLKVQTFCLRIGTKGLDCLGVASSDIKPRPQLLRHHFLNGSLSVVLLDHIISKNNLHVVFSPLDMQNALFHEQKLGLTFFLFSFFIKGGRGIRYPLMKWCVSTYMTYILEVHAFFICLLDLYVAKKMRFLLIS